MILSASEVRAKYGEHSYFSFVASRKEFGEGTRIEYETSLASSHLARVLCVS